MEIAVVDAGNIKCVEKEAVVNYVKCCYEGKLSLTTGFGNMEKHDVDESCFHRAGVERLPGVLSGEAGRGGSGDINIHNIFLSVLCKRAEMNSEGRNRRWDLKWGCEIK